MKFTKVPLLAQILIASVLAIVVGLLMQDHVKAAEIYISPFGTIFFNMLNFLLVPVVLFSIMDGIVSSKDVKRLGTIGGVTLVYFLATTIGAVTLAVVVTKKLIGILPVLSTEGLTYKVTEHISFVDFVINLFPSNFIKPLSNSNMLQIIVMALILGFAINFTGTKIEKTQEVLHNLDNLFMVALDMIMAFSPIAVFCHLAPEVAKEGTVLVGALGKVVLIAYGCYFFHALVVYSLTVKLGANMSPLKFFKGMLPAIFFAAATSSSSATLPLNMECTEKLGALRSVNGFVLPLGATLNMDGTAIYLGVSTVFIANCYGIQLTTGQLGLIVIMSVLASVGAAGVPSAGMKMLITVLSVMNIPVAGMALVVGMDNVFDAGRTVVNILGDAACTMMVSHKQQEINNSKMEEIKKKLDIMEAEEMANIDIEE